MASTNKVCTGAVSAPTVCRVFERLCVAAGFSDSWMNPGHIQPGLIYVVRAYAFGTVGGKEVASGEAPAQHSYMSQVVGFYPSQVREAMGFSHWEGFVVEVERPHSDSTFRVTLTMTPAFAGRPEAESVCQMIRRGI